MDIPGIPLLDPPAIRNRPLSIAVDATAWINSCSVQTVYYQRMIIFMLAHTGPQWQWLKAFTTGHIHDVDSAVITPTDGNLSPLREYTLLRESLSGGQRKCCTWGARRKMICIKCSSCEVINQQYCLIRWEGCMAAVTGAKINRWNNDIYSSYLHPTRQSLCPQHVRILGISARPILNESGVWLMMRTHISPVSSPCVSRLWLAPP